MLFGPSFKIVEIARVNFALRPTGEVIERTKLKERCPLFKPIKTQLFPLPFPPLPSDPLVMH